MMTPIDEIRLTLSKETSAEAKSNLGQFMTPSSTADFLASLLNPVKFDHCDLLDPGAGIGTLSIAFLNRLADVRAMSKKIKATVCEIDPRMRRELVRTLPQFIEAGADIQIEGDDFIETAVNWLQFSPTRRFTHVIMNPPYKKYCKARCDATVLASRHTVQAILGKWRKWQRRPAAERTEPRRLCHTAETRPRQRTYSQS